MTPEEFVTMIAEEHPIEPMDGWNECRFCGTSWAEDTFQEWKGRGGDNPDRTFINKHHDSDCVWVMANKILAGMVVV